MKELLRDTSVSVLAAAVIMFALSRLKKKYRFVSWNTLVAVLFTFFVAVIFSLTGISPVSGFGLSNIGKDINLVPFVGIFKMLYGGVDFYSVTNVVGNILMFAPIGFLVPIMCKRYDSLVKAGAVGGALSVIIEISQMVLIRGTDIDDIILNTLGTLLGYGVYKLYRRIMPKISEKIALSNSVNSPELVFVCVAVCYLAVVLLGFYDRMLYFNDVV